MKKLQKLKLKVGKCHTFDDIILQLTDIGYERIEKLANSGQFLVFGGNLSIYPIDLVHPIRVEMFGNEIERIYQYDQNLGKKIKVISKIEILPNVLIIDDKNKIKPGNLVVHVDHGIGIFSHFQYKKISNKYVLYIVLRYINNDQLYVPIKLIDKISPYVGVGRRKPKLSRLGSKSWKKNYKKTYENILLFARELLKIYAGRKIVRRDNWKIFKDWNEEIIKTFGYIDTPDQGKAIVQIFSGLQKKIPIDYLICGDVGFGKTEVAIRVATQACANGYQVAMLVPTTVLTEQHFVMLENRFKNLPITISHLSRFVESEKQKSIIKDIEKGKIDIVVATHKLLGKSIKFKNLGLLIIDEEQKFGVKQKERLKQLKVNLDVLSLTATPIPRTLFMTLSGLRDISQINSVPKGRKLILTKVKKYDDVIIKKYINKELDRNGQVYYLHNEVRTIEGVRNKIKKMFPRKVVEVAHGQMNEKILAQTMSNFAAGKIDILVCSTIIENGLDLPRVNTLIVEDADKFGLSQLYQIRGRIGRSPRQAYALFTYKDKKITDNAYKRLKTLLENTELGTGYNIALSDLEIRGGGNVLGREQHGNMEAVGLVLYTKLLNKVIEKLKNQTTKNTHK